MEKKQYDNYLKILECELIPAMGCTEPIAIAFAAAKARQVLGVMPEHMVARCSGNIIKNVKGVNVPNAGGQKGVEVASILGALAGNADLELQVISKVSKEAIEQVRELAARKICVCELEEGVENLFIRIEAYAGGESAVVEVKSKHNHISRVEKNGKVLMTADDILSEDGGDKSQLNLRDILEFANTVKLADVEDMIRTQIEYNTAISNEGLEGEWGAEVGKTLIKMGSRSLSTRAAARAAAGSDARMNGCALPVVINSGSGNQGITCTMPVVTYAESMKADQETLYRAMVLTNLVALHQKRYIGNLSAYCGAVSAGTAAACGIAYLNGENYDVIGKTIINALGNTGGIVCDGAKASCAAKIATSVEAGILGYEMAKCGRAFSFGEGIVEEDYEQTIRNFGRLAKEGMKSTDIEILNIIPATPMRVRGTLESQQCTGHKRPPDVGK
ncbi:MAG: L-serine ammonia-lyase, iron-sulfur-dependent, subunit alpha [Pseudoflavonifractor sp.]|nr:L-serine ammonia-lyase, iron-sulfur-dependent, subunit alpha [Pseudoflavonifractor sp.]